MKWLLVLFSIFKAFTAGGGSHEMPNPVAEIKEMIKVNAIKVMIAFACVSALATILAAGVVILCLETANQYQLEGFIHLSAVHMMALTLILLPIIIGAIVVERYERENKKVKVKKETLTDIGTTHPLQDALALLVQDYIKEREMKRAQEESEPRTPRPEHKHEEKRPHHPPGPDRFPTPDDFRH